MTRHLSKFIFLILFISCGLTSNKKAEAKAGDVEIKWKDKLTGDFSFHKNGDYPEGVCKNKFGQLSCDGFCPDGVDSMKDENGKIYKDSLKSFYQIVDTTKQFHSIQSEAWTYEWAGTNYATATNVNKNTVVCYTHLNAATHSSLKLTIKNNKCTPQIIFKSIDASIEPKTYTYKSGIIEIDKNRWEKGILKANFDLTFNHYENPKKPMFWKGKIYVNIGN